ncbi:hypothetical protein B5566_02725 [Mycobacterium sp. MHSD3]|nr:hypothetical protein B5566_02725 [Mycobacterium sp. MHSD3]
MAKASGRRDTGDGGLYKRANGLYVGAVDVPTTDGKRHRAYVSSKSYTIAAKKLRKLVKEIEDGTYTASGSTTVEQWCNRWLTSIVKPNVRPKTYLYYESAVRIQIVPNIGAVKLSKLTQEHVRHMHRAIWKTGSTRNAVKGHQALQKALADAVCEGLIPRNVADLVKKPQHTAKTYGALTAAQATHLVNTAVDLGDPLASRWAGGFYTGARPAEILGLTWPYVDLENEVIVLAWQLQHVSKVHGCAAGAAAADGGFPCGRVRPGWCPQARWDLPPGLDHRVLEGSLLLTPPKTKAGFRVVPIARPLLQMLRAHRAATAGQPNPHDLVWHIDGRPIYDRDDRRSWLALTEAAGLAKRKAGSGAVDGGPRKRREAVEWEVRPPAPYISRHTMGTMLEDAEVPEDVRMKLMGHNSIAAHRGYLHGGQGALRKAITALEDALDVEVDEEEPDCGVS